METVQTHRKQFLPDEHRTQFRDLRFTRGTNSRRIEFGRRSNQAPIDHQTRIVYDPQFPEALQEIGCRRGHLKTDRTEITYETARIETTLRGPPAVLSRFIAAGLSSRSIASSTPDRQISGAPSHQDTLARQAGRFRIFQHGTNRQELDVIQAQRPTDLLLKCRPMVLDQRITCTNLRAVRRVARVHLSTIAERILDFLLDKVGFGGRTGIPMLVHRGALNRATDVIAASFGASSAAKRASAPMLQSSLWTRTGVVPATT